MKKRLLTTIPVLLVVFLCSYGVYAASENPAPLVYATNTRSYLNGDLEVFTVAEIDSAVLIDYTQSTTTNELQGTTNVFYYDADYLWDCPMQVSVSVINNTDKYIVVPDGSLYNNWTMSYTNYTNNGQNTQGSSTYMGYYIEDPFGVVYQTTSTPSVIFKSDTMKYGDDIIIEPGQNFTYQYTVHFNFKAWTHNNATIYDPFDCNLSVTTATTLSNNSQAAEYTNEEMIANGYLPNSIVAWLQAIYDNGDAIYDQLVSQYPSITSFIGSANNTLYNHNYSLDTPFSGNVRVITEPAHVTDYDFEIDSIADQGGDNTVYCIPVTIIYSIFNNTSNTYTSNSFLYNINLDYTVPSGYKLVGYDHNVVSFNGVNLYNFYNKQIQFRLSNIVSNKAVIANGELFYHIMKINYYVVAGNYGTFSAETVPAIDFTLSSYDKPTFTVYSQTLFSSIPKNFADIRDLITQWLETGNANGTTQDISDEAAANQTQEDAIHAAETQWYSDNANNLSAVGLSNYQYDPTVVTGLSGVTGQFAYVWNKLGPWTNIYIFVLSLSFATFILRHHPRTRSSQNYRDQPKGET